MRVAPPAAWLRMHEASANRPPPFLRGTGVIDTGAAISLISDSAARTLKLPLAGAATVAGVGVDPDRPWQRAAPSTLRTFNAVISLDDVEFEIEIAAFSMPELVLIGRDILEHLQLRIDGPGRSLTVTRAG